MWAHDGLGIYMEYFYDFYYDEYDDVHDNFDDNIYHDVNDDLDNHEYDFYDFDNYDAAASNRNIITKVQDKTENNVHVNL